MCYNKCNNGRTEQASSENFPKYIRRQASPDYIHALKKSPKVTQHTPVNWQACRGGCLSCRLRDRIHLVPRKAQHISQSDVMTNQRMREANVRTCDMECRIIVSWVYSKLVITTRSEIQKSSRDNEDRGAYQIRVTQGSNQVRHWHNPNHQFQYKFTMCKFKSRKADYKLITKHLWWNAAQSPEGSCWANLYNPLLHTFSIHQIYHILAKAPLLPMWQVILYFTTTTMLHQANFLLSAVCTQCGPSSI